MQGAWFLGKNNASVSFMCLEGGSISLWSADWAAFQGLPIWYLSYKAFPSCKSWNCKALRQNHRLAWAEARPCRVYLSWSGGIVQGGGREQAECYFGNTTLDVEGQIGEEARLRGLSAVGFHHGFLEKTEQQHRKQWNQLQEHKADLRSGRERGGGGRSWTRGPTGGKVMEPLCDLVVMDCAFVRTHYPTR